jgi:hypothetical protein
MSQITIIAISACPRQPSQQGRLIVAIIACLLLNCGASGQRPPQDLIQRVDDAEVARENNLSGYTVTEQYSVFRNGSSQPAAEALVKTVYKKGQGKEYTVTSRSGSSVLQKHLLDRVLEEERKISRGDDRNNVLVTSANYTIQLERQESIQGRDCFVLKLSPKSKSPHLIEGHAWVDSQNYHLVRVEGKLSARPSIWSGRPTIRRDYQELRGFAVATSSRSESTSLFFGTTVLSIEYQNYDVTP